MNDPAMDALLETLTPSSDGLWVEVVIQRTSNGFALRHARDAAQPPENLKSLRLQDLRTLAQSTADGAFRPLKAAPNLPCGWICSLANPDELAQALRSLYPGSVADWHALRSGAAQPVSYQAHVGRQSGMYRIAQHLTQTQATQLARACCAAEFCLKQRLWTTDAQPSQDLAGKSVVPCLEPCALLLELARKTARLEQEETRTLRVSSTEMEILLTALGTAVESRPNKLREGDFSTPSNPRLVALVRERLKDQHPAVAATVPPKT